MRTSRFLLATSKQTPANAEIISHKLMLKAGLIRKLASGLYSWLPLGVRVLNKISNIVREEMNRTGALEVLMPVTQPADLWQESGRFEQYGAELLKFQDRHQRDFVLGPTHEEVITDIARKEIKSYKQLPINLYQIQTKFRDEIRPRFGIMRSREFIMKDAYSFHIDQESLEETYQKMHKAYCQIFDRCGLDYRPVVADSGTIGGSKSQEFHVIADAGEDEIAFGSESDYAVNVELAPAIKPKVNKSAGETISKIATINAKTISDVANMLQVSPKKSIKTLIITDADTNVFAIILRGDHQLNELKLGKLDCIKMPFNFASEAIMEQHKLFLGSIGPVNLKMPLIVDHSAAVLTDFVCGANEKDFHFTGVNWNVDVRLEQSFDIRNVVNGDPSPDGKGKLTIARGIEVGHIFQLGCKYSKALKAEVLDQNSTSQPITMGCYGIGVTRLVAAAIEQSHDDKGIIWHEAIAPFSVGIVPINYHKSNKVKFTADKIYQELIDLKIEVLIDDRNERPGAMFADMELIGIPHRITVGEKSLSNGHVEYKHRQNDQALDIELENITSFIKTSL